MIIHTFVYNQNKINLPKSNCSYMIWNYDSIIELLKKKYIDFEIYFKKLILMKSRENLIKYIVLCEYGGIFINIELLKLSNSENINLIENYSKSNKYDIIFWKEKNHADITLDIFNVDDIVNDDIIIIKNNSNNFIKNLLLNINQCVIPMNEYQNKIYLGNIFVSKKLSHYVVNTEYDKSFLNYANLKIVHNLKILFNLNNQHNYIQINNSFPFDSKYKSKIYPDVPDLSDPETKMIFWEKIDKIKKFVENTFIFLIFQNKNLMWTISLICLIVIFNYFLIEYIKNSLDVHIKPVGSAQIDSKVFFNPKKFKFLKQLQKNWKVIRDEGLNVMMNAPKLDIFRTIDDWHGASKYFNTIKNKQGWIRSWSYTSDKFNNINFSQDGNHEWLNYGLLYFGEEFVENVKLCPKTFELINSLKSHINICGFSWMFGGCLLQPHTDITGLSSGSLAMHLGLSIPKPVDTCKLIIKNENGEFMSINENDGKMFIFDATWEHYAYNLSNHDRLILYIDFVV